jgi:hypothetical protein
LSIRERYVALCGLAGVGVWSLVEDGLAGFKAGATEHTWRLGEPSAVRLTFMKPCKGGGDIFLDVVAGDGTEALAGKTGYDERVMDWFRSFAAALAEHLRIQVQEVDNGVDV